VEMGWYVCLYWVFVPGYEPASFVNCAKFNRAFHPSISILPYHLMTIGFSEI
jgi:hypothetical protein